MLPGAAKAHEAAALNAAAPVVLAPRRRKKVDYTGQQVRCATRCDVLRCVLCCVLRRLTARAVCALCAVLCCVSTRAATHTGLQVQRANDSDGDYNVGMDTVPASDDDDEPEAGSGRGGKGRVCHSGSKRPPVTARDQEAPDATRGAPLPLPLRP